MERVNGQQTVFTYELPRRIVRQTLQSMNGGQWRVITPILLAVLSVVMALSMWILTDVKESMKTNTKLIIDHITQPSYHSNLSNALKVMDGRLDRLESR